MSKIDFLAIGDTVIDTFIKLKDAHVHCNIDKEGCELCMRFGSKVPYEESITTPAAGNSTNASVAVAKLGLKTAVMTNIGDDQKGKDCLASFKKNNVSTKYITVEKNKSTSHNYILWYDIDRTILTKHTQFDYKFPKIKEVSYIYLTSLAENSISYHAEILEYLKKYSKTKLVFQPGTFQIKLGAEKLKEIYNLTEIFFCNKEEAGKILNTEDKDLLNLSKGIKNLGPKIIFITDGENGSYMYFNDELWHMPIYPNEIPMLEATGAGDAFSSAVTCAIMLGKNPQEAFTWGPVNSMSVVRQIGSQAGLLSRKEIENYLKNAPENYKAVKIN